MTVPKPPRPCLTCGRLQRDGSRCREHQRQYKQERYGNDWPAIRDRALRHHVALYGYQCPGYGDTGWHYSEDLTVDHVIPGSREGGIAILCRSCNGRKGAK